ncbi:MAG TPA: GDSL-type esterase/lipase family protein [Pirellulaceae bacterium]|jgi:lysophospholipase L1-like esterase
MKKLIHLSVAAVLVLVSSLVTRAQQPQSSAATSAQQPHDSSRWDKAIAAFEAQDKINPPPKDALLFIGSSTIVRWKTLAQDYPDHKVINRGFGGSQIADSVNFADRIIIPYAPRAVFLRAGGNDLNAGKSVEQVFNDFKAFVAKIQSKLPNTDIFFIGLSPSIARWKQADKEKELNYLVRDYVAGKPHLKYIESFDMVLGPDGKPREDLFVEDKLHFNAEGNKLLAEKVRPYLPK